MAHPQARTSSVRTAAATLAATVTLAPATTLSQPVAKQRRRCGLLFTVRMGERAARAVYRDGHRVTLRNLRLLGRIEMCQRNPRAQGFVRWFDRHQAALAAARSWSSATASWFQDAGSTACGFHATYGFATLNGTPCGGRVVFSHAGRQVVGVRKDSGPYVSGREFDLNPGLRAALQCSDLCSVSWRPAR